MNINIKLSLFLLSFIFFSCQDENLNLKEEKESVALPLDSDFTPSEGVDSTNKNLRQSSGNFIHYISDFLWTMTDETGQIEIGYYKYNSHPAVDARNHVTATAVVPSGWVCIGGGATVASLKPFSMSTAYLTESRPATGAHQYKGWVVSSKDHVEPDPHTLIMYVVGMRLKDHSGNYLSEAVVKSHLNIHPKTSSPAQHPTTYVTIPTSEVLIGGGAKTNWTTQGCLLTKSMPFGSNGWIVAGKDHVRPETTTITAYALTIDKNIPNFGNISSFYDEWWGGWQTTGLANAYYKKTDKKNIVVCPGIASDYTGHGRLIRSIGYYASSDREGTNLFEVRGQTKDHSSVSAGRVILKPLLIRKE